MNKNRNPLIIAFAMALGLFSCKAPEILNQTTLRPVPEAFGAIPSDTLNSAVINWKTFFADPVLTELIEEALRNNPDVLAVSQKIEMANANVKLSEGAMRPFVSGGVMPGIRRFGLYTMDGAGNATTDIQEGKLIPTDLPDFYVGLQTTWEIDAWHKLRHQKKSAAFRYLSSIAGRNLVLTNLIAEIALSYFELIMLDNQLIVLSETIQLQEEALAVVKAQKEAGVVTELGVKQFEAQVFNTRAFEAETKQAILEIENKINFLAGRYPEPVSRAVADFMERIPVQIKTGIPAQLLKNRPDVRQAEYDLLAARADVDAARAAFYPSVSITGGLGLQAFNPTLLASPKSIAYNLLGGLTAPVFNKSAINAAFMNANASQMEAFYNYQKSILSGFFEVNNEVASIRTLETMYDFKNKEVTALIEAVEISTELFKTGRATFLELLSAQQSMLAARLELIRIKQQQFEAVSNIYKALGGGWQ